MSALSSTQLVTESGHTAPVKLIQFGSNGVMVTADVDMRLHVWEDNSVKLKLDLRTPNPRHRPHDRIRSVSLDADCRAMAVAAGTRLVVLDSHTGDELWRHQVSEWWPFMLNNPQCVVIGSNHELYVTFDDGSLEKWNQNEGRIFKRKHRHTPVWFRIDEKQSVIVGADAYSLSSWDISTGSISRLTTLPDHAYSFACSVESSTIAIRTTNTILLYDAVSHELREVIDLIPGPPLIAFNPSGTRLGFSMGDNVCVLSLGSQERMILPASDSHLVSLSLGLEGEVWIGHVDGSVIRRSLGGESK